MTEEPEHSEAEGRERLWGELPDRLWWLVPLLTASAATYQLVTWTSSGRWGPPELGVPVLYLVTLVILVARWRSVRGRESSSVLVPENALTGPDELVALLLDAADRLEPLGRETDATSLRGAANFAGGSSSEFLGEAAIAIKSTLACPGLPEDVRLRLNSALEQIRDAFRRVGDVPSF